MKTTIPLSIASVIVCSLFLTHIGACIVVRVASVAPHSLPDWLVSFSRAFVAI